MSYEANTAAAVSICDIGTDVNNAGPIALPQYLVTLDATTCLNFAQITAKAVIYGHNAGGGEAQEDPTSFFYDDANNALAVGAAITNTTNTNGVTIGNTQSNLAPHSSILGGQNNVIPLAAAHSAIGGGQNNSIGSVAGSAHTVIAGGFQNQILSTAYSAQYAVVGGGRDNTIQGGQGAVIAGGQDNQVGVATGGAFYASMLGGFSNSVNGNYGVIVGGQDNYGEQPHNVIVGGQDNEVRDAWSFVGAGRTNRILTGAQYSVLAGGQNNTISGGGTHEFIGAGSNNTINANASQANNGMVAGKLNNITDRVSQSIIAGGQSNTISTTGLGVDQRDNFIGAGNANQILGDVLECSILGGDSNEIRTGARTSAILSGDGNLFVAAPSTEQILFSVICGGAANQISQNTEGVSILGGGDHIGNGDYASILGGQGLTVNGKNQAALGHFNVTQGTRDSFVANDHMVVIGNGASNVARNNAFVFQHDGAAIWFQNTQVPTAASNAAAVIALTVAKPVATHAGGMTRVDVAGVASWFVCDGAVWKFVF